MPLRVGQRGNRPSPKPFSSEWNLAPFEQKPVRLPPEFPTWLESERKLLILFIICVTLVIAIGGASGGTSDGEERPPAVQPQAVETATVGPVEVQPQSIRGTEPQLPPLPTGTIEPTVIALPPTQSPP